MGRRLVGIVRQIPTGKKGPANNAGPLSSGTPRRIRTPNLLVRSQTLYPVELWAHLIRDFKTELIRFVAEREGFEPSLSFPKHA